MGHVLLLMPADPLRPRLVDPHFAAEAEAPAPPVTRSNSWTTTS